jgi:hypothetical protein
MSVFAAFRKLRQENHKFKASLGYTARPCLKNNNKNEQDLRNL